MVGFGEFIEFAVPGSGMVSGWLRGEAEDQLRDQLPSRDEMALISSILGFGILAGFTLKTAGERLGTFFADSYIRSLEP